MKLNGGRKDKKEGRRWRWRREGERKGKMKEN